MSEEKTGWTCYHCGEHFVTHTHAKLHFGTPHSGAQPACIIKAEQGLVKYIRELELRLGKAMEEDSDILRDLALQRCEKANAVAVAEELGYSRGLKDYTELAAQLEASRKEVVRLRDAMKDLLFAYENYSDVHIESVKQAEQALASTTPDPVWEHNWHVEWMRKLPVVVVGCPDMAKDGRCAPVAWLNNYPKDGEKLVAIPELKEVNK